MPGVCLARIGRSLRRSLPLVGLAALSCGGVSDPDEVVVASIAGETLTVAEMNAYFRSNLIEEEQDARDRGELDRVKSRLFDAFIDERLLVGEARRRGIEVSEEELDANAPAESEPQQRAPGTESHRRLAWQRLLLGKLEEAVARQVPPPTDEEVRAWIDDHPERFGGRVRLTIRSRRFDTVEEAADTARRIRNGLETFEETAAAGEVAAPVELEEQALSPEARGAVVGLEPGEISEPVSAYGGAFLFRLDGRTGAVDEEALVSRARRELLHERGKLANERLLGKLRATSEVVIHDRRLPFAYLPPRGAS